MQCPQCDSTDTSVSDTRYDQQSRERKRYRRCKNCGERFITIEKIRYTAKLPMVVKRDGRREEFSESKLERGLQQALAKSPISMATKKDVLVRMMGHIAKRDIEEIESQWIGQLVMHELRPLDTAAYIRFASVYRNFKDAGAFKQELDAMNQVSSDQQLKLPFDVDVQ